MGRSKTEPRPITPGDVFAVLIPDGRYGAVRVIKTSGKSSLVCTTPYLGAEVPHLGDPALSEVLRRSFFAWQDEPSIIWVDGLPPEDSTRIGNIPVGEAEGAIDGLAYGGAWDEGVGLDVYRQWRWDHERDAFIEKTQRERQALERRLRERRHRPKKMMGEDAFWRIIGLLDWGHEGEDERVTQPAVHELSRMSKRDIGQFEEALAYKLYLLDTGEHARNIGECSYRSEEDFFSADGFLYARCAVVANGKEVYEAALDDPTRMLKDLEFEALLALAPTAYERKTGDSFDYETGCSYETFSNRKGWE